MTTEELFNEYSDLIQFEEGDPEYLIDKEDFQIAMIKFTRYHVKKALEAADNNAEICVIDGCYDTEPPTPVYGVESNSILNAYPEDNIK